MQQGYLFFREKDLGLPFHGGQIIRSIFRELKFILINSKVALNSAAYQATTYSHWEKGELIATLY